MKIKRYLLAAMCAVTWWGLPVTAQKPVALSLPNGGGTLRLGISGNGTDRWLTDTDEAVRKGWISIDSARVEGAPMVVVAVTNRNMPDSLRLAWMLGGCDAPKATPTIAPEYCKDNVFNVEGNQVYVYRGQVMRLRMTRAIFPPLSEVRLCDGHRQETPATAFGSGNRTDAPVLCGMTVIGRGDTAYLCLFTPHRNSDYTYKQLHKLIGKNHKKK